MSYLEVIMKKKLSTLNEFKEAFHILWKDISKYCKNCKDPDCLGYIWILPEEENTLLTAGMQTVQVNDENGPIFIDSYERDAEGDLVVNKLKPKCPYRSCDGQCSLHAYRPMICQIYPLGFETQTNGEFVWALHIDCAYVRYMIQSGQSNDLVSKIKDIINRIDVSLKDKIFNEYRKVSDISKKPIGESNYIVIEKCKEFSLNEQKNAIFD